MVFFHSNTPCLGTKLLNLRSKFKFSAPPPLHAKLKKKLKVGNKSGETKLFSAGGGGGMISKQNIHPWLGGWKDITLLIYMRNEVKWMNIQK